MLTVNVFEAMRADELVAGKSRNCNELFQILSCLDLDCLAGSSEGDRGEGN
jgi:hypothetical protein